MGKFFESLPSEVLEDEVPRRSELIKRVSCRRGAIVMLTLRRLKEFSLCSCAGLRQSFERSASSSCERARIGSERAQR